MDNGYLYYIYSQVEFRLQGQIFQLLNVISRRICLKDKQNNNQDI